MRDPVRTAVAAVVRGLIDLSVFRIMFEKKVGAESITHSSRSNIKGDTSG